MTGSEKPFLTVLSSKRGNPNQVPAAPWWMMRQAGRYLPEYREIRGQAGGFLDLVYNPELACEVTMQPIRRYRMSAAILFSDILVVPQALGQDVRFEEGEGPVLQPVRDEAALAALRQDRFDDILAPVYQTVRNIRASLSAEGFHDTALIGFAGSPWTVASYMVEGGGSKEFIHAKTWAYGDPRSFARLIDLLIDHTTAYLLEQVRAGAEAVQLFDSWAGVLDKDAFRALVTEPTRRIVARLKDEYPDVPVIGFPRGAGVKYLDYVQGTGVDAVSLDPSVPTKWAARMLQPHCVVQGNLDPVHLLAAGDQMTLAMEQIFADLKEGPFIFNLGHGIHKDTPPEHIDKLKELIYQF